MKVAFIHDHIFYEVNNKIYSPGGLPYNVWLRYLSCFNEVIVMGRRGDNKNINIERMVQSSGERVSFKLHSNYTGPRDYFLRKKRSVAPIRELVDNVDACIIRLPSILGILAIQECIKSKKPYLVEIVACCWDSLWNYGNIQGKLFAPYMYLLNRYYINQSHYNIYVSKDFLQKRYPSKGKSIGISDTNLQSISEEALASRIRKINLIDSNSEMVLGMIGSLDIDYKGHRFALEAINILRKKGYKVSLRCLGGGSKDRWINLCRNLKIEEYVEFCGTLPSGNPVLSWIDEIDIFIMPSLQEGLPRSMVEAMSRGCTVIGARTGGIPELIEDEFIVKRKDSKHLAEKVIEVIKDKNLMLEQAQRNFLVSKKYDKSILESDREAFLKEFTVTSVDKSEFISRQ